MKLKELVQEAMEKDEKTFDGLNAGRATKIASAILQVLAEEIDKLEEGKIAVSGFGNFLVKQVKREKKGVESTVKKVVFRGRSKK